MDTDKLTFIADSSMERTLSLQRKYICLNAYGFSLLAFIQVCIGACFLDYSYILFFTLLGISAYSYANFNERLSSRQLSGLGVFLLFTFCILGYSYLPSGAAAAIFLLPLGVTLLTLSISFTTALVLYIVGISFCFLVDLYGLRLFPETKVLPFVTFVTVFLYAIIVLLHQVIRARKSVESALSKIKLAEKVLERRNDQLTCHKNALNIVNEKLERSNTFLNDTLQQEASLTSLLVVKVEDQEHLANAIHNDLRQPLRSIVSFSQLIQKRLESNPKVEGLQDYLGFAVDGAQRMTRMLDDLLMYTSESYHSPAEPVELNSVLKSLLFDLRDLIDRSNAEVEVGNLPVVFGFHTQLVQLFQNLLANALKFSRPGVPPKVSIFMRHEPDDPNLCSIFIADNGVGIAPDDIPKVFGLFNRVHQDQGYEGSGVGLAICRKIAVAHGATISLTSIQGEGTTFKLTFKLGSIVSVNDRKLISQLTSS